MTISSKPIGAQTWRKSAACRGVDPELFYAPETVDEAKTICAGCPVIEACYAYGLRYESWGIWGGRGQYALGRERKRLALAPQPVEPTPPPCGSWEGYESHVRLHTAVCEPCVQAQEAHRLLVAVIAETPITEDQLGLWLSEERGVG